MRTTLLTSALASCDWVAAISLRPGHMIAVLKIILRKSTAKGSTMKSCPFTPAHYYICTKYIFALLEYVVEVVPDDSVENVFFFAIF